ncbi:MAG: hypothetical protein JW735_12710 [Prolixibacteraceae bacterium]|jgi:hypothetical protein|nr:hypothetical protein [Prolixibacteraceae bacterium]
MKKTFLMFTAVVAVLSMGLYSCIPDPADSNPPTIEVTSPVADTINVFVGDSLDFEITLASENGLKSLLALSSSANVTLINNDLDFNDTSSETVTVTAVVGEGALDGETAEVVFTVNDANKSANTKKVVVAKVKETPLSEATDFEWKRVGGSAGSGLEMFGLTWTINKSTMVNAIIRKDADKFVELAPEQWTTITNIEALVEAVDAAEDMDEWNKISADASKSYDLCLATVKEGKYFLIHITNSTVSVGDVGTTISITGQYKE